jgi:hypothetical protein
MQTWRDINGFEGLYQVSNTGEVRSLDRVQVIANRWGGLTERTIRGKILTQAICKNNSYYSCSFYDIEGNEKRMYVHRVVASTHLEAIEGKDYVNHKDGNKLNNNVENLEWCTRSENMDHALSTGLSSNIGNTHYRAKRVIDTVTGVTYGSVKEAANKCGYTNSYLKNMLAGHNKNITSLQYA